MANAFFDLPAVRNEPVLSYAPGSPERMALKTSLQALKSSTLDIPMYIGAERVFEGERYAIRPETVVLSPFRENGRPVSVEVHKLQAIEADGQIRFTPLPWV